jgi:hypothetical protein
MKEKYYFPCFLELTIGCYKQQLLDEFCQEKKNNEHVVDDNDAAMSTARLREGGWIFSIFQKYPTRLPTGFFASILLFA